MIKISPRGDGGGVIDTLYKSSTDDVAAAAAAKLPRSSSQVVTASSVGNLPVFNTNLKFEDGYQFYPDALDDGGGTAGMSRQMMTGSKMMML